LLNESPISLAKLAGLEGFDQLEGKESLAKAGNSMTDVAAF
jgi:hypothetical protein